MDLHSGSFACTSKPVISLSHQWLSPDLQLILMVPMPLRDASHTLSPLSFGLGKSYLVSPRRLINILESSCPLIHPISPTPSEVTDPLIPEITMTIPFSPSNDSENEDENELLVSILSPLYVKEEEDTSMSVLTSSIAGPTTTVTTTNAVWPITPTTAALDSITAKSFSKETSPRKYGKRLKRLLHAHGKRKEQSKEFVLDLSGLSIQKLEKTSLSSPAALTTDLYLDNNCLQALPTLASYKKLTKVSLINNQIDNLQWFESLHSLKALDLSQNKLSTMDGLWKLCHLTNVNLSGNEIQTLTRYSSNAVSKLESLDLSDNKIHLVEDLSRLTNLKEFLLHRNRLKSLQRCKMFLPTSLRRLTLAENLILNLSDVAELSHLEGIEELSLKQNPCLNLVQLVDSQNIPVSPSKSFDYRPYILTWCPTLKILDDQQVGEAERSKSLLLLEDEKFHQVSRAKHFSLIAYLSIACPQPPQQLGNNKGEAAPPGVVTSQSSFQTDLSFSNNNLHKIDTASLGSMNVEDSVINTGCSPGGPCQHYIELIEEKAKNHLLQRKREVLQARIDELVQNVEVLERSMVKNGCNPDDLCIKIEVEEDINVDN